MVRFLVETEQSYVESLKVILKVSPGVMLKVNMRIVFVLLCTPAKSVFEVEKGLIVVLN